MSCNLLSPTATNTQQVQTHFKMDHVLLQVVCGGETQQMWTDAASLTPPCNTQNVEHFESWKKLKIIYDVTLVQPG